MGETRTKAELQHQADRGAQAMRHYPGYLEIMSDLPDDEAHIDCTVDLITDLLHLAKIKWQADPICLLVTARMHYEAEQNEKLIPLKYCDDCADEHDWLFPLPEREYGECPLCHEGERMVNVRHHCGELRKA